MLWELTLRFGVFPPSLTAGVLVGFVALATVLAWKPDLAPVFWIAHGTAALTALALSIATRDLIPFIVALLLMVLICEYAVTRGRGQGVRPLVLAVTDAAVLALIFVYSGPQEHPGNIPGSRFGGASCPCLHALRGLRRQRLDQDSTASTSNDSLRDDPVDGGLLAGRVDCTFCRTG